MVADHFLGLFGLGIAGHRRRRSRASLFLLCDGSSNPGRRVKYCRIENKALKRAKHLRVLIPVDLSVRIHAGVSERRQRTDPDDLPGLDALKRHEAFWNKRKQVLNSV